jgi:uncharacterized protein (UPF0333 family)
MSTTTTTALTNINIMADILNGVVQPAKIFVTNSTVIRDSDPNISEVRNVSTYEINSSSDITKEPDIVKDICNAVFGSPGMPVPTIKVD